jgi:hypothetical protein
MGGYKKFPSDNNVGRKKKQLELMDVNAKVSAAIGWD